MLWGVRATLFKLNLTICVNINGILVRVRVGERDC